MRCPACDREVADSANFCPFCGLHLRSTRDEGRTTELSQQRVAARAQSTPELRRCPRCGAPNSPARVLCGRCGTDLDADAGPSDVPGSDFVAEPTAPPRRARRRERRWRFGAAVVATVVVGTAIGAVAAVRLGPARPSEPAPHPTFADETYADDPSRLTVGSVAASSTLRGDGGASYAPELVADGDVSTAWNEGAPGSGEDAELTLRLETRSWIDAVIVWNGDQEDGRAFRANARASRVLLAFDDDGPRFEVHLDDARGPQVVELPDPVLADAVVVRILEVVEGERYDDLAISEVELLGWEDAGAG